jgi:hypothetical protein
MVNSQKPPYTSFLTPSIALFLAVHLLMVALVPKVLLPMITGGKLETE